MVVIAAFVVSNMIQKESGLLTVTLLGIILTNQKGVNIKPIIEFKENLGVLLLSALFIILAASLNLEALAQIGIRSIAFLLVLIFLARPAAVILSTVNSGLSWNEKIFLAWMAPRGIVAAAVTSVFAFELVEEAGYQEAELMVAEIFLVIVGTVTIYGLGAAPLGRWLGIAQPDPQGVLFVGAHDWARTVAQSLQREGFQVLLVDTNHENISAARLAGLPTLFASILAEHVHDEIELGGFGRMLALTHNDEVNALATLRFAETFGRAGVYQLAPEETENGLREVVSVVKATSLTEQFGYQAFQELYGSSAQPLFLIDETSSLLIFTTDRQRDPQPGQTLISLVDPVEDNENGGVNWGATP
jgi:hypothetical protein